MEEGGLRLGSTYDEGQRGRGGGVVTMEGGSSESLKSYGSRVFDVPVDSNAGEAIVFKATRPKKRTRIKHSK